MLSVIARRSAAAAVARSVTVSMPSAVRGFSSDAEEPVEMTADGAIVVDNVAFTLEWILSSPPPLHAYEEPPIMVEWPVGEEAAH